MSKRSYPVWDYPSNTKQNPIPPANSSQERNRGVGIPQSQQSTAAKKSFPKPETAIPMDRQLYREALEAQTSAAIPQRGQNARQNYKPPTRGRPTQNTGVQRQSSGKGNQTTGTAGTTRRTGTTSTTKAAGTAKTTGRPPYRSSYASAADLADMNEIMGVNPYTGEAQDVADDFLRQSGVSSPEEYQKKFFAGQEAKRRAQEERARQMRTLYGSPEDEAEILGLSGGYTGDPNDVAAAVQREYGANNAEEFREILQNRMSIWDYPDYLNRRYKGGYLTSLQDLANGLSYGAQGGMAHQEADQAMAADQFNGGAASRAAMEEYYAGLTENQRTAMEVMGFVDPTQFYYPQVYNEAEARHKDDVLTRAADWGDSYRAETDEKYDDVPNWLSRWGDKREENGKWYLANAASFVPVIGPALSSIIVYEQVSTERYEQGLRSGETREQARRAACAEGLGTVVLGQAISKGLGKLAEAGTRQLSKVAPEHLERLSRTLQKTPGGNALINALTNADEQDAGALTGLISDSFANEVERVGSYSSREDFLNEDSVTRMAGAVLEGTSRLLGLPGAGGSSSASAIRDSREAVIVERAITTVAKEVRENDEIKRVVGRIIQAVEQGETPDYLTGILHEKRGNALIFPPEYGIIYPDGKRYPVVVSPYSEAKPIIKQLELPDTQAHHVAPNAIYRDTIARNDGITISLPGNVLTNPESAHGKFHNHTETQMDMYRESNTRPTNREAYEIFLESLQFAGVNKNVAEFSLDWLIRQQMERGIYPEMPIPRMPQKIHFKKKNVVEEDAGNAENIQ